LSLRETPGEKTIMERNCSYVLVDSKIMVESLQPVSAGALKGLGNNITPDRVLDLPVGTGGSAVPGTMQSIIKDIVVGIISSLIVDILRGDDVIDFVLKKAAEEERNGEPILREAPLPKVSQAAEFFENLSRQLKPRTKRLYALNSKRGTSNIFGKSLVVFQPLRLHVVPVFFFAPAYRLLGGAPFAHCLRHCCRAPCIALRKCKGLAFFAMELKAVGWP
jgi:hypothetical protein